MRLPRTSRPLRAYGAGVFIALVPVLLLRKFTVDDALIIARYAAHLAAGHGYRFNAKGPITDGVTPLGYPYLLAPFAGGGPLAALRAARLVGAGLWLSSAGALLQQMDATGKARRRFFPVALLLCSAPLAAWSVAGMETGVITGALTWAVVLAERGCPCSAAALLGLCGFARPELGPYVGLVGVASALRIPPPAHAPWGGLRLLCLSLATFPWFLAAGLRWAFFHRAAPLSALAKPSDWVHGVAYTGASLLLLGFPVAIAAPFLWRGLSTFRRSLVAGALLHAAVLIVVGGDWMPLSRLFVPVAPSLLLVATSLCERSSLRAAAARITLGVVGQLYVWSRVGVSAASVLDTRLQLIQEAAPLLATREVVAAVDIGWVGASTEATILDLAGVTDPEIAVLPGGHTSKHVSPTLLARRQPDALVFQLQAGSSSQVTRAQRSQGELASWPLFQRVVEQRLAASTFVRDQYRVAWRTPLGRDPGYAVLVRVQPTPIAPGAPAAPVEQ